MNEKNKEQKKPNWRRIINGVSGTLFFIGGVVAILTGKEGNKSFNNKF